jgi:TIR domain
MNFERSNILTTILDNLEVDDHILFSSIAPPILTRSKGLEVSTSAAQLVFQGFRDVLTKRGDAILSEMDNVLKGADIKDFDKLAEGLKAELMKRLESALKLATPEFLSSTESIRSRINHPNMPSATALSDSIEKCKPRWLAKVDFICENLRATRLQTRIQQPMPEGSKSRVFVSHTSSDKPFVRKLTEALKGHNLNVWLDEEELQVGDSIVGGVSRGLKNADYLVAVLSQASISSRWVQAELNSALMEELSGKGVTVLPVLIEDCELPSLLRDRVYADFRSDFNAGLLKLLAVFEQEGESTEDVAPKVAAPGALCSKKLSAITLADLRRRITRRMDRDEVSALWFAVLETRMENDMVGRQLSECVISLLDKAKSRNKLPLLIEEICQDRPDLANP